MLKKWDIIIIVSLIVISFIPEIVFVFYSKGNSSNTYAEITIEGKLYKKVLLSSHQGEEKLSIKTKYGYNIIDIKDSKIKVIDADCKDGICIKQGYIYKVGQTIACIPHKLLIEVKAYKKNNEDIIITN